MKPTKTFCALAATTALLGLLPFVYSTIPTAPSIAQTQRQWVTYTAPDFFTLQHPADWIVESVNPTYYMLWNQTPPTFGGGEAPESLIKTDITLVKGSLETVLQRETEFVRLNDEQIVKGENLKIGGRDAVNTWITGSTFAFPDTLLILIRYNDEQTISIASYYTASNAIAEDTLQTLRESFRLNIP